jgi:hypothetical protein
VDGPRQRFQQLRGLARRLWSAVETLVQAAPRHVFQGKEQLAGLLSHFMDLHDVRVLEPGHRPRLALKTLAGFRGSPFPWSNQVTFLIRRRQNDLTSSLTNSWAAYGLGFLEELPPPP